MRNNKKIVNAVIREMLGVAVVVGASVACVEHGTAHAAPEKKSATTGISGALAQPSKVEFLDTPLNDATQFLGSLHKLKISLDKQALRNEGISTDELITLNLSGVSLGSVLNIMLEPIGLTYLSDGKGLTVTTRVAASQHLENSAWNVSRLVGPGKGRVQDIVRLIQNTTRGPWLDSDGVGGTISTNGRTLNISQTQQVQGEIKELLQELFRIANPKRKVAPTAARRAEARIQKVLNRKTTVRFNKTPLLDAVKLLQDTNQIPFWIDRAAFRREELAIDSPLSANYTGVPLASSLDKILDPVKLSWVIEDEVVKITTKSAADKKLTTRVYKVSDLVGKKFTPQQFINGLQKTKGLGPWLAVDGRGGVVTMLGGAAIVRQTQQSHRRINDLFKKLRKK